MFITSSRRTGTWLALAAVAILVAVLLVGFRVGRPTTTAGGPTPTSSVERPRSASVPPTRQPSRPPTPVPSVRVSAPPTQPIRANSRVHVDLDDGYWYEGGLEFDATAEQFRSGCGDYLCAFGMQVHVAAPRTGVTVSFANEKAVRIRGTTLDELREVWLREVPGSRVGKLTVDGQPAFIGYDKHFDVWGFTLFNGRLYAFDPSAFFGDPRRVVLDFVAGFHFRMPDCWLLPCPSGTAPDANDTAVAMFDATKAGGTWTEQPQNEHAPADAGAARQWRFVCSDACFGQLTLSIGTTGTGAAVPSGVSTNPLSGSFTATGSARISGSTLEELEASWNRQLGRVSFEPITVNGVPAISNTGGSAPRTVLLVRGGYVLAFTSWGSIAWDRAPDIPFRAFLLGFSFVR